MKTALRTKLAVELADKISDSIVDSVLAIAEEDVPIDLHMVRRAALDTNQPRHPARVTRQVRPLTSSTHLNRWRSCTCNTEAGRKHPSLTALCWTTAEGTRTCLNCSRTVCRSSTSCLPAYPSELISTPSLAVHILTCNVSFEYEKTEITAGFYYSSAEERERLGRHCDSGDIRDMLSPCVSSLFPSSTEQLKASESSPTRRSGK